MQHTKLVHMLSGRAIYKPTSKSLTITNIISSHIYFHKFFLPNYDHITIPTNIKFKYWIAPKYSMSKSERILTLKEHR